MKVLVAYESIYGNTRAVAEAVAEGLRPLADVSVLPLHEADLSAVLDADLLVVGGPTHMHGLSTSMSRRMAAQAGDEEDVAVEPGAADGPGLRGWLSERRGEGRQAAAFDTRADRSAAMTGAASRGIARRLRRRGYDLVADPESFLVEDTEGPLADGELERARDWGRTVAERSRRG
jgi:hypothetical protein